MGVLTSLRNFSSLRRGVRALERIAEAQMRMADIMQRHWEEDHPIPKQDKTKTTFDTFDIEEAEKRYQRLRSERMLDADEEGDNSL